VRFVLEAIVPNLMLPAFAEGVTHVLALAEFHRVHQPRLYLSLSIMNDMCAAGVRLLEYGIIEPAATLLSMLEQTMHESPATPGLHLKARTHLALAQVVDSIGISGRHTALIRRQTAFEIVLQICNDTGVVPDETKRLFCSECIELAKSCLDLGQMAAADDILHRAFSQLQELDGETIFPRDYANCYDALSQLSTAR
jgi:hypothetical protein